MNWSRIKTRYKEALDHMCRWLAEELSKEDGLHKGAISFFFDRDNEIHILTGIDMRKVTHEQIINYFDKRWNIFINVQTDVLGGGLQRMYSLSWLEGDVMYTSDMFGPYEDFSEMYQGAYWKGFKLVMKLKKLGELAGD